MPHLEFIRSYQGWATDERWYQPGERIEVDDALAAYLCDKLGRARRLPDRPLLAKTRPTSAASRRKKP